MSDVIIAIVPAPGHEGLVAAWMPQGFRGTVERPARVIRCSCGAWACPVMADGHMLTHDDALILHAPGGPRLGMVRALEALAVGPDVRAYRCYDGLPRGKWWDRPDFYSDRKRELRLDWPIPEHTFLGEPNAIGDFPHPGASAYALAHLALQRGLASEVLVLPAPS